MVALLGQGRLFFFAGELREGKAGKMECLLESKEKLLDINNNNSYY